MGVLRQWNRVNDFADGNRQPPECDRIECYAETIQQNDGREQRKWNGCE